MPGRYFSFRMRLDSRAICKETRSSSPTRLIKYIFREKLGPGKGRGCAKPNRAMLFKRHKGVMIAHPSPAATMPVNVSDKFEFEASWYVNSKPPQMHFYFGADMRLRAPANQV